MLLDGASAAAVLYRDSAGARSATETLIDTALAAGPAGGTPADASLPEQKEITAQAKTGYRNAGIPVTAWPSDSACISSVPS